MKVTPYITENGNFVLDTIFQSISDVRNKEIELKSTPGVIEVGLFTKHASVYYKANDNGSFETIRSWMFALRSAKDCTKYFL